MIKKILMALGISMMSAMPLTQASPMTANNEFNFEVKIDKSFIELSAKDDKNNPPPTFNTDGKEDHLDKDRTNPPPKPPENDGQAINGNKNTPPPSDKDNGNKHEPRLNEKFQPKDDDNNVKKADIKDKKDSKTDVKKKVKKKVKEDVEDKTKKKSK